MSSADCCSFVFTGTKRIDGRLTASQIASAPAVSFLLRLTQAFTYCGGIRRTSCPSALSSRAQSLRLLSAHQGHLMSFAQGRRCTGLHANQTRRQASKKHQHLTPLQPLARYLQTRFIDAVNLKNALGQIQPNRCNLAHGWLLFMVTFDGHPFGTRMP
jgi:hypothetical protein